MPDGRAGFTRQGFEAWVDVPLVGTGVVDMSFGSTFVDGGAIRARLEPQGSELAIDQLDLSIEGEAE